MPLDRERAGVFSQFTDFVRWESNSFERSHGAGHVTGSALVVTDDLGQVLLTLHRKLQKWLQLGGHADGDSKIHEVALREAAEESGLNDLEFFPYESIFTWSRRPLIFDLDIHKIPARPTEPEHLHYDARYLIRTHSPHSIQISTESKDLKWFTLQEAYAITSEESMHRQFQKLEWLRSKL